MKYVSPLAQAERAALERVYRRGDTHRQRPRAHAVLLSAGGHSVAQLAAIFAADRDTVSRWLDAWGQRGLDGLADAPKSGRPPKATAEVEAVLLDLMQNPTPALKPAVEAALRKKTSRSRGPR